MSNVSGLPSINEIIPHRGTMLLLDRLIQFENDTTIAEYTPRSNAWYADIEGQMPSWFGIELMAQTIAAHAGLLKLIRGDLPKQGVLLGTRRYKSSVPHFSANKVLHIQITMIYSDISGLGAYDCRITAGLNELATATLKVFEPDDFQTYLQGSLS